MELLNKGEYLSCYLYDSLNTPTIVYLNKKKGDILPLNDIYNQIVFLLEGKINLLREQYFNRIIEKDSFLLSPRGFNYIMNVEEDSTVVIVNMHEKINFCHRFPFEILFKLKESLGIDHHSAAYPLKINEMLSDYLNTIVRSISDGMGCTYFHEVKQRELLFYLRAYYSKRDLTAFFAPILCNDTVFAKSVYQHYESAKNVGDLAGLTHYSISGFKKRFKKVFGIPPHNWMEREKAKKIYYEINCTQKTFKEISIEYSFSSPAHFDRFCKKVYGVPPGILREKSLLSNLLDA